MKDGSPSSSDLPVSSAESESEGGKGEKKHKIKLHYFFIFLKKTEYHRDLGGLKKYNDPKVWINNAYLNICHNYKVSVKSGAH